MKKGIEIEGYTSLKDEEGNHIAAIIDELRQEAAERDEQNLYENDNEPEPMTLDQKLELLRKERGLDTYFENDEVEEKPKKCKYRYPKLILVFDDMAEQLRDPTYNSLLKWARHFQISTFTSSQYLKDILPSSRLQMRAWILFGNLPDRQLEDIHNSLSLRLPYDVFLSLYKHATRPTLNNPKPFFYFQPKAEDYRKNLTHRYIIPESVYNISNNLK
jgi:hypothetical protein